MKVLLTGATGLIGSRLGVEMARRGWSITALTRSGKQADLCFPARCVPWDFHSSPDARALTGDDNPFDVVIHLAGEPVAQRWTTRAKKRILSSRADSTKALASAFANSTKIPRAWINASAIGFYGNTGQLDVTENTPAGKGFLADVCQSWEDAVSELRGKSRVARLRFGVVLSQEGGALPEMTTPVRYGFGGPIGKGDQGISWIHIDDAIEAIIHAATTQTVEGPVNVTSPDPVSQKDFVRTLAQRLKRPGFMPTPAMTLRLLLGEMSEIVIHGAFVRPTKLIESGFSFKFPTLRSAVDHLFPEMMTATTRLYTARQWIDGTPDRHFPFFAAAENLERITPPWLNFKITRKSSPVMGAGNIIDYRLRIKGVPVKWRTRIEAWDPPRMFVDTQLHGPYRLWHHTHEFTEVAGGTLMTDTVYYRMWFWPFGDLALPMVRRDIQSIFSYRKKIIADIV